MKTYDAPTPAKRTRPLLGVRERPGRLALAVFRLPLPLYRAGWGWLLGHTFVLVVHAGRKTGQPHAMTAMVLRYEPATSEVVVCANWGPTSDWIRNIRARPALRVQIGRESFAPQHRFLTNEESFAVAVDFRRRHPYRVRFAGAGPGLGRPALRRRAPRLRRHPAVRGLPTCTRKGFRRPRRTCPGDWVSPVEATSLARSVSCWGAPKAMTATASLGRRHVGR